MSTTFPKYRLYDETGLSLIYTFDNVIDDGGAIYNDAINFAEHTSFRGIGSNTIDGSKQAFDLPITFDLISQGDTDEEKYIDLLAKIKNVRDTILTGTKYILKIDENLSTTLDLKVKRLGSIETPLENGQKKLNFQRVTVNFRVRSWN